MLNYIDRKYKPKDDDLVCEFRVEPARGLSIEEVCEKIAGESSIDTWTEISTMNPVMAKKLKPHVYSIDKKTKEVKIAYPSDLFEAGNIPQILSAVGGNIFSMKVVNNLRLQDIHLPNLILKSFKGPLYGLYGIRKLLKVPSRPLIGTIVKPKVGLNEVQHARVAYEAWMGGLDAVKMDENLTSMKFNKFEKQVKETLKLRDKAEKETGERKVYFANVTAETREMISRAKYVKSLGGEYVMIDIITSGWAALQTLRESDLGLAIHAHRAGHSMLTRNPYHGCSMLVIAKIARLIGVDQIHIGALAKMEGPSEEVEHIGEEIEDKFIAEDRKTHILQQNWEHIKPIFAVCSGGLHPALLPRLVKLLGKDIIAQFGGGCHGHPKGTRAGAMAIRQAVDATMQNIPLNEYARTHKELALALKTWGKITYKDL